MKEQLISLQPFQGEHQQQTYSNGQLNLFSNKNYLQPLINTSRQMQRPIQNINTNNSQNASSCFYVEQQMPMSPNQQQEIFKMFQISIELIIEDQDLKDYQKQFFFENFLKQPKSKKNLQFCCSYQQTIDKIRACQDDEKIKFVNYFKDEKQKYKELILYLEAYQEKCSAQYKQFIEKILPKIELIKYGTLVILDIQKKYIKLYNNLKDIRNREKILGPQKKNHNCWHLDIKVRQLFHNIKYIKAKQEQITIEENGKADQETQTDYQLKYQNILDILLQSEEIKMQKDEYQIISIIQELDAFCFGEKMQNVEIPINYLEEIDQHIQNFLLSLLKQEGVPQIMERMKELEVTKKLIQTIFNFSK
ncbi:hypothetical protein TTHERM_00312520 (macronuclear) [Tetrahymena thermophila SB210]|uniref:Uncharacterized protein n=1 Tax=Tetrahymena thermophila (strain SB210) TaxID=312017 RepID=Q22KM9_TETTS|nr:hypothetical protein TTHERM_00312520 [Tetrahymena thermophila SB210]EAR85770.4 hypothetical protein TTHERM_00312520 [Tetrahymena thermophila SB210]|eukprot:XP_001033433.4 hypothetical protein TTHERM_00312520 [Tetrahymena thermophila SB210]